MPNTTNFNWPTPADTDLVKDGAAAIRNLGDGVDTSLVDLKGGTTGQILSKASNADMDFTFITPNGGDFVKITSGSFSAVAGVNIDSCFTSTYDNYFAYVNFTGSSSGATLEFQWRVGSTSSTGAGYYASGFAYDRGNTLSTFGTVNGTEAQITGAIGAASNSFNNLNMYFEGVGISGTDLAHLYGQSRFGNSQSTGLFSTIYGPGTGGVNYNGFSVFPSAGDITGNYVVYGLVK